MSGNKLKRTVQCAKCPWKVATNPTEIPGDYSLELHKGLADTIAEPGSLQSTCRVMACHHAMPGDEVDHYCVGYLYNQLGVGNNIPLRLKMLSYANAKDIAIKGEQHQRFEDTLPK